MSQHFVQSAQDNRPAASPARASGMRPSNNMTMAAVSLLAAWPLAIVAMVHASSVNKKWDAGDQAGAHKAAGKAKGWAIAAWAVTGVVLMIILAAG